MKKCTNGCRMVKVAEICDRDGDIVAEQYMCTECRAQERRTS